MVQKQKLIPWEDLMYLTDQEFAEKMESTLEVIFFINKGIARVQGSQGNKERNRFETQILPPIHKNHRRINENLNQFH